MAKAPLGVEGLNFEQLGDQISLQNVTFLEDQKSIISREAYARSVKLTHRRNADRPEARNMEQENKRKT